MPLPPWVIQEIEEERRRREEDERVRQSRIELPQVPRSDERDDASPATAGYVRILDISPRDTNTIDI